MPKTARTHFDEDIARVESLLELSREVEDDNGARRLTSDIRSSAIALSIGAMDAYLCDAYVDCLSAVLRAYRQGSWNGKLPAYYAKQALPAGQVLDTSRPHRPLWAIRMAARSVMERENILSIDRINDRFNPILPTDQKIWADFLPKLMALGHKRLTGPVTAKSFQSCTGQAKTNATKKAIAVVKSRINKIAQIRHDWIHNCGRPKLAIVDYSIGEAASRVHHVRFFIETLDDHIDKHRIA